MSGFKRSLTEVEKKKLYLQGLLWSGRHERPWRETPSLERLKKKMFERKRHFTHFLRADQKTRKLGGGKGGVDRDKTARNGTA